MKLLKRINKNFMDMDKGILIVSFILIVFGTLNIITASSREAVVNLDANIYYYFFKHIVILIISLIGFLIITQINTKIYNKFMLIVLIVIALLNAILIFNGASTRGAQNWIDLGFFKLQPSELAKPVLIVSLGLLFEKHYKNLKKDNISHISMLIPIIIIGSSFPVLVALQKDLGTASILLGIFGILFIFSPISRKEKGTISCILIALACLLLSVFFVFAGSFLSDAQMSRFKYFNPCSKYSTNGYQVCNAFIAINNGGLTGVGLGKSTQKYSYIPEPHTDMVFSIITEEGGVIIGILIFIAYLYLLFKILKLSMKVNRISHKYICLGAATYIFLHIFINLGGLFGLIPLTGVPLPFLSYGGSFTISLIGMLGIIQRISIEHRNERIKIK